MPRAGVDQSGDALLDGRDSYAVGMFAVAVARAVLDKDGTIGLQGVIGTGGATTSDVRYCHDSRLAGGLAVDSAGGRWPLE